MLSKCVYGGGSWRCFTSTWYGASDVSLPVYFPALNVSASSLPIISALSALSGGLGSHDWDEVNVPLWPLWGAVTLLKLPARTEGGGGGGKVCGQLRALRSIARGTCPTSVAVYLLSLWLAALRAFCFAPASSSVYICSIFRLSNPTRWDAPWGYRLQRIPLVFPSAPTEGCFLSS